LYKMHEDLAATVDDINEKQKMIKDNLDKVKDSSTKKLMIEFNTKLEEERGQLLASKQKSIFADEQRLREKITDVYSAVASQESPPSNLQIQRAEQLQKDVVTEKQKVQQINTKYYKPVFDQLMKEGLVKPKAF
jgi:NADH dehydrogenase/NADH:ubiquinone oxidoreductase subunit G